MGLHAFGARRPVHATRLGHPAGSPPVGGQGSGAPTTTAPSSGGADTTSTSGSSNSTSGNTGSGGVGATSPRVTNPGTAAPVATAPAANAVARSQFQQRAEGATTGVTRANGQAAFRNSAAKAPRKAKKAAADRPSSRSASGDLWSGFTPRSRSSVLAAEAAGGDAGAPTAALLVALGLGVVGAFGSVAVLALRRRPAAARAARHDSD